MSFSLWMAQCNINYILWFFNLDIKKCNSDIDIWSDAADAALLFDCQGVSS